MAAIPEHMQPCVKRGGWGEGWIMSQAHMLASVPDLLVSPIRHVTQHRTVCEKMMKPCGKCRTHHMQMLDEYMCFLHIGHTPIGLFHSVCVCGTGL